MRTLLKQAQQYERERRSKCEQPGTRQLGRCGVLLRSGTLEAFRAGRPKVGVGVEQGGVYYSSASAPDAMWPLPRSV